MVSAGDDGYHSMARASLDELSDILLYYLGDVLISRAQIASVDPTINDLLSTGRNVLMLVRSKYLRKRSALYWPNFIRHDYSPRENPEDLFSSLSDMLQGYHGLRLRGTCLSLVVTPGVKTVSGAASRLINMDPNDRHSWDHLKSLIEDFAGSKIGVLANLISGIEIQVLVEIYEEPAATIRLLNKPSVFFS